MSSEEGEQQYGTIPNQVYGCPNAGGSPRECALMYQQENDAMQTEMISPTGGGRRRRSHSRRGHRRSYRKRGGQAAGAELEVPSFPQAGPATSPLNSTSASIATNQAALDAKVAACNDCYATGTCDQTIGCPQQGGRKTRRHHRKNKGGTMRSKPFALSSRRVKLSPFRSEASVKKTLKAHRAGRKIGFTQKSSLRSMGLIKRKNGKYVLGSKYAKV